jgi:hypothetical protein
MKITKLDTVLVNAGLRNYLFVRLTTNTGLTGLGEASLEWQEKAVEALIHEWVADRVLGGDPFDVEALIGGLIRDQYQGGATIMTAISSVEIACWDLIGKACGQPVYRLLGGRVRDQLPSYANGWYGGARVPGDYAARARAVLERGYRALKFDPFGIAWKEMTPAQMDEAEQIVAAVRAAVGDGVALMIEVHGRLSPGCAIAMGQRLVQYSPEWYEEPVAPLALELLADVKLSLPFPVAAGERLAGSPGVMAHPGLPQIRTCAINAYGSSSHRLAYSTVHRVDRQRRRQRVSPQQPVEDRPRHEAAPSSTRQPFLPDADHRHTEPRQRNAVARDPVVGEMTPQFLAQRLALRRDRLMPVQPTPLGNQLECPAQAALGRLPLHHPDSPLRPAPVVRKAQEVETAGLGPSRGRRR